MNGYYIAVFFILESGWFWTQFAESSTCGLGQCTNNTLCCPSQRQCCNDLDLCCGEHCCRHGYECCHGSPRCCKSSSQCCGDSLCCPENANCCPNQKHCCPAGFRCCDETSGCCPEDHLCCGKYCCPAGSYCCPNGTGCFKAGYRCCGNGLSCPMGFQCCGEECCSSGFKCCGSMCCKDDDMCCGDKCCNISPVSTDTPLSISRKPVTQAPRRTSYISSTSNWSERPKATSKPVKDELSTGEYSEWVYFMLIPIGFLAVFISMMVCCMFDKHKRTLEKLKDVVLKSIKGDKPDVHAIDKY